MTVILFYYVAIKKDILNKLPVYSKFSKLFHYYKVHHGNHMLNDYFYSTLLFYSWVTEDENDTSTDFGPSGVRALPLGVAA